MRLLKTFTCRLHFCSWSSEDDPFIFRWHHWRTFTFLNVVWTFTTESFDYHEIGHFSFLKNKKKDRNAIIPHQRMNPFILTNNMTSFFSMPPFSIHHFIQEFCCIGVYCLLHPHRTSRVWFWYVWFLQNDFHSNYILLSQHIPYCFNKYILKN